MEVLELVAKEHTKNFASQFVGRSEAKEAKSLHHLRIIKEEMKGKSKCDQIYIKDVRVMQDFMKEKSLENARMEVLWMTNMIDTRSTMKGKYNTQFCCPHCKEGREQGTLETPTIYCSVKPTYSLGKAVTQKTTLLTEQSI